MTSSPDLINRTKLRAIYEKWLPQLTSPEDAGDRTGVETCLIMLNDAPAVNAEPIVEAHWDMINIEAYWIPECYETGEKSLRRMPFCSCCQHVFGLAALRYKRCPECGAHITGTVERNDVVYTKETADGELVVKEG